MNRCCKLFGSLFFTVLTLASLGAMTSICVACLIIYKTAKLDNISDTSFIILVISCCLCVVAFCFGIYASCCGEKCAKSVLAVFYLVFALLIIGATVFIQTSADTVLDKLRQIWYDEDYKEEIDEVKKELQCSSYVSCRNKIKKMLVDYGVYIYSVMYVFAGLLILGVVLAFVMVCRRPVHEEGIMYTGNKGYYTRY